jgi:hypothetical protein
MLEIIYWSSFILACGVAIAPAILIALGVPS